MEIVLIVIVALATGGRPVDLPSRQEAGLGRLAGSETLAKRRSNRAGPCWADGSLSR